VRLLVDTHVLIWAINEPERIPRRVGEAMGSPGNLTFVSAVCLWEIAIKSRMGKLEAPQELPDLVDRHPDFRVLEINAAHAWKVRSLPTLHRDPFDQMLVAQALVENMTVVTHDRMLARYGVPIIAV
jgi:PIN domain nuclease of toxin-antitoxin system